MLGKGYYPYEDGDSWEKLDETIIPPKEAFYSKLNLEGISYWWLKRELEAEFAKQHIGMLKQTINIWKITIKHWVIILEFLDVNNVYGWAMSQKLPVNGFKWVENSSEFKEGFIKKHDEDSNTGYFLEVDVEYLKDLPFLP